MIAYFLSLSVEKKTVDSKNPISFNIGHELGYNKLNIVHDPSPNMIDLSAGGYQVTDFTCPACSYTQAKMISHLMDIPYYTDFLMINISCSACGLRSSDFMNTQSKGHTIYRYHVTDQADSYTKMVRARNGVVSIDILGITIEPMEKPVTWIRNIEGILEDIEAMLLLTRRNADTEEEVVEIDKRLELLRRMMEYQVEFTISVNDIDGNSIIIPAIESKLVIETV